MGVTGSDVWGDYPDREAAKKLLQSAVNAGVNLIDTADACGPHSNEVGPDYLRQGGYISAGRLGFDSIPLYYLHSQIG
jgi:aryl-alcohol dehydrogenase-like predicted oxidoreductase